MHINEILDEISTPLELTSFATLSPVQGGTINKAFKVTDGDKRYFLKYFVGTDLFRVDRNAVFSIQKALHKLHLAPQPIFLSEDNLLYVEEWLALPNKNTKSPLSENSLNFLAEQMHKIHLYKFETQVHNLNDTWLHYLAFTSNKELHYKYESVSALYENSSINEQDIVFCHNDLSWDNVEPSLDIIMDWEYSGMGSRYFDIAACIAINSFDELQTRQFMTRYADLSGIDMRYAKQQVKLNLHFYRYTSELWYDLAAEVC